MTNCFPIQTMLYFLVRNKQYLTLGIHVHCRYKQCLTLGSDEKSLTLGLDTNYDKQNNA